MPYTSTYGYYDSPAYGLYGQYGLLQPSIPNIYSSPAFQWGYQAAAQYATRLPKRRRRAMSQQPETDSVSIKVSQSSSAEYPPLYPSTKARRAAIDKKLEEMEISEAMSEPLVPPVSLSSLRSRLLAAADLNDGAKRLYDRYTKEVEDVGGYTRYDPSSRKY